MDSSDFLVDKKLVYELILALVSLDYFSTHLKDNFRSKWPVETYFLMINRAYNTNDRLNFILKVIKQDYNTNDWLKFILTLIK